MDAGRVREERGRGNGALSVMADIRERFRSRGGSGRLKAGLARSRRCRPQPELSRRFAPKRPLLFEPDPVAVRALIKVRARGHREDRDEIRAMLGKMNEVDGVRGRDDAAVVFLSHEQPS